MKSAKHNLNLAQRCCAAPFIVAAALLLFVSPLHAQDYSANTTLWNIGTPDQDDSEFALAPSDWSHYSKDPIFIVGSSNPKTDWPYVQPGPDDNWAGTREHTDSIFFGLTTVPTAGTCHLAISLIDSQSNYAPQLEITVNGQSWTRQTENGNSDDALNGSPGKGHHSVVTVDFPATLLHLGANGVSVSTVQGSWMVYDAISLDTPRGTALTHLSQFAEIQSAKWLTNVLARKDGKLDQVLQVTTVNSGPAEKYPIYVTGEGEQIVNIPSGRRSFSLYFPESSGYQRSEINLVSGDDNKFSGVYADRTPCRRYTIFEIEQSHMDIGYAYLQQKTLDIHTQDIVDAFNQFPKTAGYPPDAQFRWNCESLIETDAWLKKATPGQIVQFQKAVRSGQLGLTALYCNELTGLCRPEELVALVADANEIRTKYGVPIDSAMITDVPGYTWGMVPILAESGIKYFSWGPNIGDHIGVARSFDDQAFYWVSPSGKDKVLVWQSNNGYNPAFTDDNDSLVAYMQNFAKRFPNTPYDMIYDRHTINDNGPIDPALPAFVREWNSKFAYPHLVIATNSQMFHAFEDRYGKTLPSISGDYTGYWEDGAVSTASETALNRINSDKAAQNEILWSMIDPNGFPSGLIDDQLKNAVLYDEHTWGAYDSWANPESDFDKSQWTWKRQYALNTQADETLLTQKAAALLHGSASSQTIAVFNTSNWPRTELIKIPASSSSTGDVVLDEHGNSVPSQRLSDGTLAVLVQDIPALSSRKFRVMPGKSTYVGSAKADVSGLTTKRMTVSLDPFDGDVFHWTFDLAKDIDLVNGSDPISHGLNDYIYVLGDDNSSVQHSDQLTSPIQVLDNGPLVATVRVVSDAPGCKSVTKTYQIVDGLDQVAISDRLDKLAVHTDEAVHLGFNFNVPNSVVRLDEPWSVVRPDVDQTPNANKNVFPVGRWCDISNNNYGITCANISTPMLEIGEITQPRESESHWLDSAKQGSTIFWQVMNNYWHTNYKAYQPGIANFDYVLLPHLAFEQADAQHFGMNSSQPLIVMPVQSSSADYKLPLTISNNAVVVTSCHPIGAGNDWFVRLFNSSNTQQIVTVGWSGAQRLLVKTTDLWGKNGVKSGATLSLPQTGIVTLTLHLQK